MQDHFSQISARESVPLASASSGPSKTQRWVSAVLGTGGVFYVLHYLAFTGETTVSTACTALASVVLLRVATSRSVTNSRSVANASSRTTQSSNGLRLGFFMLMAGVLLAALLALISLAAET